jgi:hypothetical protein
MIKLKPIKSMNEPQENIQEFYVFEKYLGLGNVRDLEHLRFLLKEKGIIHPKYTKMMECMGCEELKRFAFFSMKPDDGGKETISIYRFLQILKSESYSDIFGYISELKEPNSIVEILIYCLGNAELYIDSFFQLYSLLRWFQSKHIVRFKSLLSEMYFKKEHLTRNEVIALFFRVFGYIS